MLPYQQVAAWPSRASERFNFDLIAQHSTVNKMSTWIQYTMLLTLVALGCSQNNRLCFSFSSIRQINTQCCCLWHAQLFLRRAPTYIMLFPLAVFNYLKQNADKKKYIVAAFDSIQLITLTYNVVLGNIQLFPKII